MTALSITAGISTEHLQRVYSDPRMQRIGHDHRPVGPVNHPLAAYLSAWIDGEFVGAFLTIRASTVEIDLHALLLASAVKESRALCRMAVDWAFEQPDVLRVTGYVIDGLDSALNYCRKVGLQYEGCRRHACLQNGVPRDVHILGATRKDWMKS